MKFYKLQVKSATVNIDLPNDKEAPSGLVLKERQIRGQRETATRSVDTKEKVHKSVQVSEVSASRS